MLPARRHRLLRALPLGVRAGPEQGRHAERLGRLLVRRQDRARPLRRRQPRVGADRRRCRRTCRRPCSPPRTARFYENKGFSPKGYARAVWVKLRGGSTQGGSTITQQYVKNYFLTQDRTATRKAKEFVIALKIEQSESKDKILENYLNTIYFGRGANGVQTASKAYFGVPVDKLDLSQSALLAAIIRSPGLYDPVKHKANAPGADGLRAGRHGQGGLDHAGPSGPPRSSRRSPSARPTTASAAPTATC